MNQELGAILHELAVLYDLEGIRFKPRAFDRAADAVQNLSTDIRDIYEDGGREALEDIPGVGPGIAERIEEYLKKGRISEYVRMKKKLPVDIADMTAVEGVGPKTLKALYQKLKIKNRVQLEKAAQAGKLAGVPGIGARGQERILRALAYLKESGTRKLPGFLWPIIKKIADRIASVSGVKTLELVGSLRRMQETIGDLDFLAIAEDADRVLHAFVAMPEVRSVYSHGSHRALVRLHMGMDADLAVVPAESYGSALIAWTGSKAHNIHLRTIAKKKKLLLDDYGLFRGTKAIAGRTEQGVYEKLGMQWIPSEMRSDTGEIEAALDGTLPNLVDYGDVQGDLQVQTDWSDGKHSILMMAKAARALGMKYIAITDHTKSLTIANGLDEKRIKQQWREIDRVQKLVRDVKILKGTECDIKKDGSLDLADDILAELDVVGISVHSYFNFSEEDQMARIIRAMEHPHADIFFHPTGRLVQRREAYAIDMKRLVAAAKRTGTILEVNAHPARLDLNGEHVRMAVAEGVRVSISTDAHAVDELGYTRWGIGQARRGWATKDDVINTRPWREMLAQLKS